MTKKKQTCDASPHIVCIASSRFGCDRVETPPTSARGVRFTCIYVYYSSGVTMTNKKHKVKKKGRSCRREADLRERLERVPIRVEEGFDARALRHERNVLVEELGEQRWFVERAHEAVLHLLRAMVHEQMHDRLWHQVLDTLPHDREIRYDQ
jgi:hypothetical protein